MTGAIYHSFVQEMPSSPPLLPGADPSCPFCAIAAAFPPAAPSARFDFQTSTSAATTTHSHSTGDPLDPEKTFPPSYVILSTPDVIAFLDIAPLTRGHILLATRRHRVKTVELSTTEGAEVCILCFHFWLSISFFLEFHASYFRRSLRSISAEVWAPLHVPSLSPSRLSQQSTAVLHYSCPSFKHPIRS